MSKYCSRECFRLNSPVQNIGKDSPNWKGGIRKERSGYIIISKHGHPNARKSGCIPEHRYIMEKYLLKTSPNHPALIIKNEQKVLSNKWDVHHKNGIRDDNRICNLEILIKSVHNSLPKPKRCTGKNIQCIQCNKEFWIHRCEFSFKKFCSRKCYWIHKKGYTPKEYLSL
jgi:hypothetical protein